MLKINNLSKIYHTKQEEIIAIKNFSLEIIKGEFVILIGPSGCGKSTILSILAGLEKLSTGIIISKNKLNIGYMLQHDALLEWKSVFDNCMLGLKIKNNINKNNTQYVLDLLNNYGLQEFIYSKPMNLSGGMKQRCALIRTLAINPDLILLDEPFSLLDYQTRLILNDDLYKIIKHQDKTAIMVTHDIQEAVSLADRIIILSNRPSCVKKIIKINLSQKPSDNRKDIRFNIYCKKIKKEIDNYV